MLLPHLPTRQIWQKEPQVDYNMFHVVIFEEYLNIAWSKVMAKVVGNEMKECKQKEKEERRSKRVAKTLIIVEHATQRSIKKWAKV